MSYINDAFVAWAFFLWEIAQKPVSSNITDTKSFTLSYLCTSCVNSHNYYRDPFIVVCDIALILACLNSAWVSSEEKSSYYS